MAAQSGDFDQLLREHARLVAAAIHRVCGLRFRALVPDVQQEVYLALWRHLRTGKTIDQPAAYLYKVSLTTALRVVKKHRRVEPVDPERLPERTMAGAEPEMLPAERAHLLDQVLAQLEPDAARALRGYLAGFNHREVAQLYGWTESRARHLIYRSMERLRSKLGAEAEGQRQAGQVRRERSA